MLVVGQRLTQAPNDKQQIEPMIEGLQALPKALGEIDAVIADTGYASAHNVLRGLEKVQGEWTLVCMAWNMKRLFVLAG